VIKTSFDFWILAFILLGVIIGIGTLVLVVLRRKTVKETNYKTFFILGIPFMGLGSAWIAIDSLRTMGIIFLCLGAVYLSIGLANRNKWKTIKSSKE
jgi:hypothetical protein